MIGVYDSGYGGLTVLRHLRAALPDHDFVYLGDSGRAPYGGRDVHTVLDFAEQAVERLFEEGCCLVVVACHTVSCVALRHLQRRYAPPEGERRVLGVTIPAAEQAAAVARRRVGVLATPRTVASGTYAVELHKIRADLEVVQQPAALLAGIVEEGWTDTDVARAAVRRYVAALGEVDTLVLGCTHYPLLLPAIREAAGPAVRVLDPGPHVAERLVDWLARHPGFAAPGSGALRVLCTGDPVRFARQGGRFLGAPLPDVVRIAEVGGRLEHRPDHVEPVGQVVR